MNTATFVKPEDTKCRSVGRCSVWDPHLGGIRSGAAPREEGRGFGSCRSAQWARSGWGFSSSRV